MSWYRSNQEDDLGEIYDDLDLDGRVVCQEGDSVDRCTHVECVNYRRRKLIHQDSHGFDGCNPDGIHCEKKVHSQWCDRTGDPSLKRQA